MAKQNGSKYFYRLLLSTMAVALVVSAALSSAITVPNALADGDGQQAVTVRSKDSAGNTISGFYTALYNSDGSMVYDGFTPSIFSFDSAGQYVGVSDFGNYVFDHWEEDGTTNRYHGVSGTSDIILTAVYRDISLPVSVPQTEALNVSPGQGATKDEFESYIQKAKDLFVTESVKVAEDGTVSTTVVIKEIPSINLSGNKVESDPSLTYAEYDSLFDILSQDPEGTRFAIEAAEEAGIDWNGLSEMQQCYIILKLRTS